MEEQQETSFEHEILLPLIDRSISFLNDDLGINVSSDAIDIISPKKVELKKNTAMIGTGGSVQVLITMGYDDELLDKVVASFLEGEEVEEDELEEIQESVSCEVVNTIVGNALKNPLDGTTLGISPPILIYEAKSLFRQKSSQIATATIKTEFGEMLLTAVGPKESFSKTLNLRNYKMLNILVVDDSLIIRKNIKKYITSLGHSIVGEAKNGTQAIEFCKELKPDLITMDITMPDMDGITAVKHIREFDKDVNIIMVTSHGQEEMVVMSLKSGAQGYLLKPINEEKLAHSIGNIYEEYAQDTDDELLDDDLIDD
ncbi:response regulator [Sulfurimonas sp.]